MAAYHCNTSGPTSFSLHGDDDIANVDSRVASVTFKDESREVPGVWAYGVRRMAYGVWRMAYGLWPMAHGAWPMEHGLWRMA